MRIRKFAKWLGIVVGTVLGIAAIAVAWVYVDVGAELERTFDLQPVAGITIPEGPEAVNEGARLARIRGCFGGCHGENAAGATWLDLPDGTYFGAPDLGQAMQTYSDEELVRIIRHGTRPDGSSVLIAMPSPMLYNLSDTDLGYILAWARTQLPGEARPATRWGPLGRLMLLQFRNMAGGTVLSAEHVDASAARPDGTSADPVERGRYLALSTCTECHGGDLRGDPAVAGGAPSLALAVAYSQDQFRHLLRTGEPIGGRELDLMAKIATKRTAYFADAEIDDLHAYLVTLASTVP